MVENQHRSVAVTLVALVTLSVPTVVRAAEGEPLAVRKWPGGTISLETQWDLVLVINPTVDAEKLLARPADQTVSTRQSVDHVLSRKPNEAKPSWLVASEVSNRDENAIHVRSVDLADVKSRAIVVSVDGVHIAYVPSDAVGKARQLKSATQEPIDLLILSVGQSSQLGSPETAKLVNSMPPCTVLVNSLEPVVQDDLANLQAATETAEIRKISHNTLAISSSEQQPAHHQIVVLKESPWQMPVALAEQFDAMEDACGKSQQVFAKLSINQLNCKPSNGTHTPRWNAEHMMGRELLYFSQIYNALDRAIPVMDLNPAQMPPDYKFAHPDWEGAEEARQIQRVSDFTRRFAYLLDGLQLDEQAPGSRWPTLGVLLKQMQRHYKEHTANTVKKFDLPDWPRE